MSGSGRPRLVDVARQATAALSAEQVASLLAEPVIILSVPRAGSELLFEQLQRLQGLWSIRGESHAIFNAFSHLRAENPAMDSGALGRVHADEKTSDDFRRCLLFLLRDHVGRSWLEQPPGHTGRVTLLEKTPRNALNIPFLLEVFREPRFVFLYRDARANIASLIEGWRTGLETGRFVTYRNLPGWDRPAWCFLLPPGWRQLRGRPLAEIAAFQWAAGNRIMLDELQQLPASRHTRVSYEKLTRDPQAAISAIADFIGLPSPAGAQQTDALPLSRTTLTAPQADKWRRHEAEIEAARHRWQPVADRLETS